MLNSVSLAKWLFVGSLVLGCAACATGIPPANTIHLEYVNAPNLSKNLNPNTNKYAKKRKNRAPKEIKALPVDAPCIFIVDSRKRSEYGGWSFPSDQVHLWLNDAVAYRFDMKGDRLDSTPEDDSYLAVEKLYIEHVGTAMTAVVVLKVNDGEDESFYRGSTTRTNWAGTDQEYSRLLSITLDEALGKISSMESGSTNCR